MINLITGLPGHGKSLFTLWHVHNRIEKENKELIAQGKEARRVFYNGIPDLKLDWEEFQDPEKWHELPAGSIIVIDECQRTFRPRGNAAAVPEHVKHLETHRHKGHDLYVITQHPLLVDGNLRRLVDRHYHVHRPFGWSKSTVLDFQGCKDQPMTKSNRADAQKSVFAFPKEFFSKYKSAEIHTAKARLPGKFVFLLAAPLLLLAMGWYAWHKLQNTAHAGKPEQVQTAPGAKPDQLPMQQQPSTKMTTEQYIEAYQPRIAGLYHTAPRYDQVTTPTRAPFPDACLATSRSCKCYSNQGTQLDVPNDLCRQIVDKGFFRDFDDQVKPNNQQAVIPANQATQPAQREQITMLGGDSPTSLDPRHGATSQAVSGAGVPDTVTAATVGRNLALAQQ